MTSFVYTSTKKTIQHHNEAASSKDGIGKLFLEFDKLWCENMTNPDLQLCAKEMFKFR